MICSKEELSYYLECDRIALSKSRKRPRFYSDEEWKFERIMRRLDYADTNHRIISKLWLKFRYHRLGLKLGFSIPYNICGPGLALFHSGTIVIATGAKIGANCCIMPCVNIGANGGTSDAATVGDNVYIAPGVKIVGGVKIGDNAAIGANAVVVKDVEPGITVGGIPARKISDHDSSSNIIKATEIIKRQ